MVTSIDVSGSNAAVQEIRRYAIVSESGVTVAAPQYVRLGLAGRFVMPRRYSVSGDANEMEPGEARPGRKTDADLVISLHNRSGLTWEQLAKAIGVSRRSLHMWAQGAAATPAHRAVMERFARLIDGFGELLPEEIKTRLFEPDSDGIAPIDRFRGTRDGGKRVINGPALHVHQMM